MNEQAAIPSMPLPVRKRRGHRWLHALVALALIVTGLALGNWQLRRAAHKEALAAQIEGQGRMPVLGPSEFLALAKPLEALHRRVRLRGLWLGSQSVYLDNRQMRGVPGFYVLTPLALEDSNETVMVQRGWVQRNFNDRTQLGAVETPSSLVEIEAVIAPPPAQLFELGKAPAVSPAGATPSAAGASPIRQNLALEAFRAETGLPLRTELSLQQIGSASQGLQRDWPAPALGVDRHYGYAFQWFGLAALVAILYVWFQLIAPFRRAGRRRHR